MKITKKSLWKIAKQRYYFLRNQRAYYNCFIAHSIAPPSNPTQAQLDAGWFAWPVSIRQSEDIT